jgi:hypothetical protein
VTPGSIEMAQRLVERMGAQVTLNLSQRVRRGLAAGSARSIAQSLQ